MTRRHRWWTALGALGAAWLVMTSCLGQAEPNALTADEQSHGWTLLFDGKTTAGWRGMKGTAFPQQTWKIEDGAIGTQEDDSGGDLITEKEYRNFELSVDWKVSPKGNTGLKYLVQDEWLSPHFRPDLTPEQKHNQWLAAVGFEFQMIDDDVIEHKPGWEKSSTGALYLLYAPQGKKVNPPGQWNTARVLVQGDHVEHWLNGKKIVEYELSSKELLDLVDKTKFRKVPGYGVRGPGHISLQHHGAPAWFRNIKIREVAEK